MGVRLPEPVERPLRPATGQATLDSLNSQRRAEQEERTRRALGALGDDCPANLRQAALLRLQHPDLSVEALGLMCDPPRTRHAVNGQLRRLNQLAEQREREAGQSGRHAQAPTTHRPEPGLTLPASRSRSR
ncbi:DNA-binding protein WhiA [Nocardioides sp. P86]|uniref:DNA-binding protein WhiA n=1 Tax=Nocardioides sp. P86 TaxID=2939569 RepID=UPI0035A8F067